MNEQEVTELLLRAILDQKDGGIRRVMIKILRTSMSESRIRDGIEALEQKGVQVAGLRTLLCINRLH
jgi:hypothetical protein